MIRLTPRQLTDKIEFIREYIKAPNAATGSELDANANITHKNIATLMGEINKDINVQLRRELIRKGIMELFGKGPADNYIKQLENHEIYSHDESCLVQPYCASVDLFPFITDGLQAFGGESKAPKHLSSYCGGFINLIFALSSQFAGAIGTPAFLTYFDFFARKDYGKQYLSSHTQLINQELQQVVYALNQPASARNAQCPFWNISIFDKSYFDAIFSTVTYPDNTKPQWESVNRLQRFFLKWFNKERTKALLTFPIVTVSLLHDNNDVVDKEYKEFISQEIAEGNSFFIYTSDTVDSLSSCCRLRSEVQDFSYSLGAGGVSTGSLAVITINLNRLIQEADRYTATRPYKDIKIEYVLNSFYKKLREQVYSVHQYLLAHKALFKELEEANMLPAYTAGFITMEKQYLTVGVSGIVEAAEFLKLIPGNNNKYRDFVADTLSIISEENKSSSKKFSNQKFNTELVPGENLGVKFAQWDKKDGYYVKRDCYNSYLYKVEDDDTTILDKFTLHGSKMVKNLDGGSALHINLEEYPTKDTVMKLLEVAVKEGCNYFCFNIKITICEDCSNIDKRTLSACPKCGSRNISYATRVIGYLRKIFNFAKERQEEAHKRYYHKV